MEGSPRATLGSIIRRQRELASMPMRQFAALVGISNPYLSQIERGLRAPSEAVMEAIASSLHMSADEIYELAGFVDAPAEEPGRDRSSLTVEIASAAELTAAQRRALLEVYRAFVDANAVRRRRRTDDT